MSRARSDLPFGSEFSPSQINLPVVLKLAYQHAGDPHAFEAAILSKYFMAHAASAEGRIGDYNRRKLANNCKLGMIAYGIIDRTATLTELGRLLYDLRGDEPKLYSELARQILLNRNGLSLIQCIQDMQVASVTVTLNSLREWLAQRGIRFPSGGKHPSIMRLWLEKAGVFISGWRIDEQRLQDLLGIIPETLEGLAGLTREQGAFLKALANAGPKEPMPTNDIARLATSTYGVQFDEKNLPKHVLYPLAGAGYIELVRGTKQAGRGAKPFLVKPTVRLLADLVTPLLE